MKNIMICAALALASYPVLAEVSVEAGMYAQSLEPCMAAIGISADIGHHWRAGMLAHGKDESCYYKQWPIYFEQQFGAWVERTFRARGWAFGLGVSLWEHGDFAVGSGKCVLIETDPRVHYSTACRSGPQFAASVSVERQLRGRWYVALRHHSTSGASQRNKGHNWLMVGMRFGGRQ